MRSLPLDVLAPKIVQRVPVLRKPRPVALHDDDAQLPGAGLARERGLVLDEHGLLEPRDLHLGLDLGIIMVGHLPGNNLALQRALDLDAPPRVRDAVRARGDPRQGRVPDQTALVRDVPESLHRQGQGLVFVPLAVRDEDIVQREVIELFGHALGPRAALVALERRDADGRGRVGRRDKLAAHRVPSLGSLHPLRARQNGRGSRVDGDRRYIRRRRHRLKRHLRSHFLWLVMSTP